MITQDQVVEMCGPDRAVTFWKALEVIRGRQCPSIVETGTFRGNVADGNSTKLLSAIAAELCGSFLSIDICPECIEKARVHVQTPTEFIVADSVAALSVTQRRIDMLYLDSLDFWTGNPAVAQMHQLAEIGAAYGKLSEHALVLLDDHRLANGGKTNLALSFLLYRGWDVIAEGYQVLVGR